MTRGQAHVVVHVDTATGTARIPGGPELPPATTERLACDARVQLLLGDRPITPPPTPSPATSKR